MKVVSKITLILIFITIVSSLHIGRHHQRTISRQCCISQGGFECGTVSKDCCALPKGVPKEKASSDLCSAGGVFGSSEYCPAGQIVTQCNYCGKVCESKSGKLCGWENPGADQCCHQEDCIAHINLDLKIKKCKSGTEIKLPSCVPDMDLEDGLIGKISGFVA